MFGPLLGLLVCLGPPESDAADSYHVFGIAVMHHATDTPRRGLQHEVQLMFSLDALALVPLAGSKSTIFKVGSRRLRG